MSLGAAGVLVFTGIVHATQPYLFIHTIASYRILPSWASGVVGLWVPHLQLTLGVCLGLNWAPRIALGLAALLFAVFSAAQVTAWTRGVDIDCGCFGFVASTVSITTILLPTSLSGACAAALYFDKWESSE